MMIRKNKLASLWFVAILVVSACASNQRDADQLAVRIVTDSISAQITDSTTFFYVECTNENTLAALLYGFESNVRTDGIDTERLCDVSRVGAGLGILIFDEKGRQMHGASGIHDEVGYMSVTDENVRQVLEQGRLNYLAGTKVVRAGDNIVSRIQIPLYKFPLRHGVYDLHVLYYAGKGVADGIVGQARIDEDEARYDAKLFQGCVASNKVKLVIQ